MSVCLERRFLIHETSVDEVVNKSHKILKEMGLKIMKEESSKKDQTTILAGEGILVPLITKAILHPFGLDDYVESAQRTGIHIVVSPAERGVNLYFCGIALDDITGKYKEYTSEEITEEITDAFEEGEFEEKFLKRLLALFPKSREIK